MDKQHFPLEIGKYYHIYNRGINGCNLFYEEKNYYYFLEKYAHYMSGVLDTFAYCLMPNHFHLLVRVKDFNTALNLTGLEDLSGLTTNLKDLENPIGFKNLSGLTTQNPLGLDKSGLHHPDKFVSKKFSDMFNSYTKSFNKVQQRTGSLFETPFRRIAVESDAYFTSLLWYIHYNPQKHGFVADFRDYPYTSFHSILSSQPSKLAREEVLQWFGSKDKFLEFHGGRQNDLAINKLLIEFD